MREYAERVAEGDARLARILLRTADEIERYRAVMLEGGTVART